MSIYVNPDSNTACQLALLSFIGLFRQVQHACLQKTAMPLVKFPLDRCSFVNSDSPKGIWVVPDSYLAVVFDTEFVLHIALFAVKKVCS
jgi:hypothetical protein